MSETVGLIVVDQTIPLSITVSPPSEVTSPPKTADVFEIDAAAVVETVGGNKIDVEL